MADLAGKVAVVTGGATGIGLATARRFARAGAAVVINYSRNVAAAEAAQGELRGQGARALAVRTDVSQDGEVRAMMDRIAAELGGIDYLVNNAGWTKRVQPHRDLESLTDDVWERVWAVNVVPDRPAAIGADGQDGRRHGDDAFAAGLEGRRRQRRAQGGEHVGASRGRNERHGDGIGVGVDGGGLVRGGNGRSSIARSAAGDAGRGARHARGLVLGGRSGDLRYSARVASSVIGISHCSSPQLFRIRAATASGRSRCRW